MKSSTIGISAALLGAFALGALVVAYSAAQSGDDDNAVQSKGTPHVSTSFSQLEESEIREIVREYLLTNPEIIIEAVNIYSMQQREQAGRLAKDVATANIGKLLDPATSHIDGKNVERAEVAIVELFDYHCGFCKRATPIIQEWLKDDAAVKVVFRELPILRDESDYAALVSLAARDQDKYMDLHFAMMGASGVLTKQRVKQIAEAQGVDFSKLEQSLETNKANYAAAILENQRLAAQMGVDGTPTFIVATLDGGFVEVVNGFRPDDLMDAVKAAKKAAK